MSFTLRRLARWSLRLLLGALGLALLYVVGANLLLRSGALPRLINGHQGMVVLGWSSAWTLLPGRVHLRDFHLRGSDGDNVEFEVHLDEVEGQVDLAALLHREFHATSVLAHGAITRVRFPFHPGQEAQLRHERALLPNIPGFADPPLAKLGPTPPPIPEDRDRRWAVHLEGVRIEGLKEAWVQQFHWTGQAALGGAFFLRPLRHAWVGPAWVELQDGTLRLGRAGQPVLEHTRGPARMQLRAFDVAELASGADALHALDLDADLTGRLAGLGWLDHFAPGLGLSAAGPVHLRPVVRGGVLSDGSQLELESARTELRGSSGSARGAAKLRASVGPRGTDLALSLDRARLAPAALRGAALEARRLQLDLHGGQIDLGQPAFRPALEARLQGGRASDLRPWLKALGSSAVAVQRGQATVEGELRLSASGKGSGRLRLGVEQGRGTVAGISAEGQLRADLRLGALDLARRSAELKGSSVRVQQVSSGSLARATSGWWADVEVASGRLSYARGKPRFEGQLRAHGRDARPLLDALASQRSLPGWAAKLFSMPGLVGSAQVRLSGDSVSARAFHLAGGHTEVSGDLQMQGKDPQGKVLVHSGLLSAGLDLATHRSSVQLLSRRPGPAALLRR